MKGDSRSSAHSPAPLPPDAFEKTAVRVSTVSIIGNIVLTLFKMLAGLLARSSAMVSDAVHSASDVLSSIIVIIGVRLSAKASDREHPYGHERFECVAAIVLAVILCITGLFIAYGVLEHLASGDARETAIPGMLAMVAAVVSILCKEGMFRYARHYAKRLDSGALMADAWHHRSDALSSVGALIGIAGARMGFPMLDKIASLVIVVFIEKAAYDIFSDAISKMVDHSCSEEVEAQIAQCASTQDGVLGVDLIQTRVFGNRIYVDIEISADANISLAESHAIAERVHDAIEAQIAKVKHIMVHVKPYSGEPRSHPVPNGFAAPETVAHADAESTHEAKKGV